MQPATLDHLEHHISVHKKEAGGQRRFDEEMVWKFFYGDYPLSNLQTKHFEVILTKTFPGVAAWRGRAGISVWNIRN